MLPKPRPLLDSRAYQHSDSVPQARTSRSRSLPVSLSLLSFSSSPLLTAPFQSCTTPSHSSLLIHVPAKVVRAHPPAFSPKCFEARILRRELLALITLDAQRCGCHADAYREDRVGKSGTRKSVLAVALLNGELDVENKAQRGGSILIDEPGLCNRRHLELHAGIKGRKLEGGRLTLASEGQYWIRISLHTISVGAKDLCVRTV